MVQRLLDIDKKGEAKKLTIKNMKDIGVFKRSTIKSVKEIRPPKKLNLKADI